MFKKILVTLDGSEFADSPPDTFWVKDEDGW